MPQDLHTSVLVLLYLEVVCVCPVLRDRVLVVSLRQLC